MRKTFFRKLGITVSATAMASAMILGSVPQALAETNASFWTGPSSATTIDNDLLKTYGVRAGSAGGDFVGVSNTNFDFTAAGAHASGQYSAYTADTLAGVNGSGLALWATSVNENVNPYYANLYYNTLTGGTAAQATTWSANPNSSSWGDSDGQASTIAGTETATINGLEYQPDIIFGANKSTGWSNFDVSSTNIGQAVANNTTGYSGYDPTFVNNDSTNLWTQIYTINNLAKTADQLSANSSRKTRYDNSSAITGALAYEKALRGNLLYIASQIDQGNVSKKTVAYLYAIDENGTGYFFIPEASGLVSDNDTGKTSSSAATTADTNYAGNNGTIDLDYMDTLPFITNTFKNGTAVDGGIVMKVEDIYKTNPAVSVDSSQTSALSGVDAIIYNTTTQTNLQGTSGGKNESNINNAAALTKDTVQTWASAHGFTGSQIIAGDDWGTSGNQGYGTADTTEDGMSPLLYCKRNYTTDKPARAAWAYSQLYSELYPNADASYAYWVKNVYHINMADVPAVVKYFTNQSDTVTYNEEINTTLENDYKTGLNWWLTTGVSDSDWNQYAYFNGSSRASYYDGSSASEEPENTIGIFAPTAEWAATATSDLANSVTDLQKQLADVQASLTQAQSDLATAQQNYQTAQSSLTTTQSELTQTRSEVSTLTDQVSTLTSQVSALQEALNAANSKASNTVKVAKSSVSVKKGKTVKVKVTKAQGKVTVKSSKKKIATASYKSGKVTIKGKKKGATTITVTAAGDSSHNAGFQTITVTVK